MPALPLHEAGKYVAAAYIVLFVLILAYVAIMATRLGRIERELGELLELTERRDPPRSGTPEAAHPASSVNRPRGEAGETSAQDASDSLGVGRPESAPA
jgi:CcmD family protein